MSPDFDELVGSDLERDERERLRYAHDLLVAAGPLPELSPSLDRTPGIEEAEVVPFFNRRRHAAIAVLAAALALADLGVAMLGALLAGLVSNVRAREVLLPVLFLPFALPLVSVAVRMTVDSIPPQNGGLGALQGLGFLALYDTIFGLLGWALFEYVVED